MRAINREVWSETLRNLFQLWLKGVFLPAIAAGQLMAADAAPTASVFSTNSPASHAPFSILQNGSVAWLAKPNGERFFSLGVCCVSPGASREEFDPDNPGYASWQYHSNSTQWAESSLGRLKSWGFTTVGAWSDFATLTQCRDSELAFAPVLHIGAAAGAPWWDMWDPKIIDRMEQTARDQILAIREDPRLIGYYSDNEMGWWNATLFKMTLEQGPGSGQRRKLIDLLKQTYHAEWVQLTKDFDPEGAANWLELEQRGMLYLKTGGKGIRVMRHFLEILAERYYSLVRDIIRKYDQRALILGDRYQSFYYPEVARASAPYVDAISSNLNVAWDDGTFPRFYLDTLHRLTKKPILVSEFYMAAEENLSGNKNSLGVYPVVKTQEERAEGFRATVRALTRIPYVIGADWFQYYDEPTHGRGDGENFNFGLVDIHDQPYGSLIAAAKALDCGALKGHADAPRPDASQGVPPAPINPFEEFQATRALKHWDRERGFVPPATEAPLADLYICWNAKAIYLGLYAQDIVEDAFYRSRIVPKSDRAEWTISPARLGKTIRARLGAGLEPIVNDGAVHLINLSGLNLDVRNIAAMELPAKLFGKTKLQAGDKIEFGSSLLTHGQAYRVDWKGVFTLRD